MGAPVTVDDLDLLDGGFHADDPHPTWAWLREHAPVWRDEANGLWGVTRHDDVLFVEKHPELFCSSEGFRPQLPPDRSMISRDEPRHTQQRRLVARRFTPKGVGTHESEIRRHARSLVDAVVGTGEAEVVSQLAAPLPAALIGHLLGFPAEMTPKLVHWSETVIEAGGGLRYIDDSRTVAAMEFAAAAGALIEDRSGCPVGDIVSTWVTAELDGCPIPHDEIVEEALLVLVGGAETTRTCIAHAVALLAQHPDQRAALAARPELLPVAVEELLRFVSPIINMTRHATQDVELGGERIGAGDEVLLLYPSANRDEAEFGPTAGQLRLDRSPNHHVAFGFGNHFCLGASLARLEIRIFLEELLARIPEWEVVEGPVRTPGAFVQGVSRLRISF